MPTKPPPTTTQKSFGLSVESNFSLKKPTPTLTLPSVVLPITVNTTGKKCTVAAPKLTVLGGTTVSWTLPGSVYTFVDPPTDATPNSGGILLQDPQGDFVSPPQISDDKLTYYWTAFTSGSGADVSYTIHIKGGGFDNITCAVPNPIIVNVSQ